MWHADAACGTRQDALLLAARRPPGTRGTRPASHEGAWVRATVLHVLSGSSGPSWVPVVPRAKPQSRADFTHSPNQLRVIGHENSILVDKIAKISVRGKDSPKMVEPTAPDKLKVASVSSAAVNRKKTYDKIAEENLKMYNRLQQIKPSAEIQRKNLAAAHKQNIEYRRNCSIIRRDSIKKKTVEDREAGWQD